MTTFRYWNVWFLPRVQVQSFVWIMSYKVFSSSLSWAGELLFSLHPEGSCGTSGQIFRVFLFIKSLKSLGANPKDFKTLRLVAGSWQIVAFLELARLLLFNWTRNILYQTNNLCGNFHFVEELFSIQGRHYQRISQAVVFCAKKCIGMDNGSYKSYSNTTQHDRSP